MFYVCSLFIYGLTLKVHFQYNKTMKWRSFNCPHISILHVSITFALQTAVSKYEATKQKRKFSSFFKSLVIELDKDLYGPDNHLVEVR